MKRIKIDTINLLNYEDKRSMGRHTDFLDFKEGNTYWLEYIGDDKYNVRSDNLLGKTYHITPCQLYTVFKKLTWLEKQGEQKPDNVETKFKVGDWVVFNNQPEKGSIYQVEKIENFQYTLRHILGGSMPLSYSKENMLRFWTIQDAKDGNVLACNEEILLFKSYSSVQGRISLHCWYNGHTNNFHSKEVVDILMNTRNKICPATREQRDFLFQKMKEEGFEWDSEKKEAIRIE